MSKQEFLAQLRRGLSGLPQDDIAERMTFYSEMIEDRMEDGLSEEEAVAAVGAVDEIVARTVSEIPLVQIAKERVKPKRQLKAWEIVLLVLGSPVWLSLLLAAFAIVLSLYVAVWSLVISLWAVFGSLAIGMLAGLLVGVIRACSGDALLGAVQAAAGMLCAGLAIFMFFACKAATKGLLVLTRRGIAWMKNCLMKREEE